MQQRFTDGLINNPPRRMMKANRLAKLLPLLDPTLRYGLAGRLSDLRQLDPAQQEQVAEVLITMIDEALTTPPPLYNGQAE